MTNKERLRLESIKSTIKLIKDYVDADTHHFETLALATELILNHGDLLIEQTERVQDLKIMLKVLGKQNKRHREALKFYADERTYEDIGIPTGNNPPALPILEDRGQVARKALEGGE